MITIIGIGQKHGYTGTDHLLDDSDLQNLIGRDYRSIAEVRRLAAVRDADAPVWMEYRCGGETREVTL